MIRLLLILALLFPSLSLAGQGMGPGPGVKGYSGSTPTTASFDFTAESLSDPWTNANWTIIPKTNIDDTARIISGIGANVIAPSSGDDIIIYWDTDTFSDKQYSSVKINNTSLLNDYSGPAVRVQADFSCYFVSIRDTSRIKVLKVTAGTPPTYTELGSTTTGLTIANDDVITLRVNGSTLQVLQNGVQVGVDRTDSTYSSGNVGIFWDAIASTYESWEGGEW